MERARPGHPAIPYFIGVTTEQGRNLIKTNSDYCCETWDGACRPPVLAQRGEEMGSLVVLLLAERAPSEGRGRSGQVPFLLAEPPR